MRTHKRCSTVIAALVIAQSALAQTHMDVLGIGGAKIIGGSVKLTPVNGEGAFYLVNDDDSDGVVVLTDWDGKPLVDGLYTVEVRGNGGNFVRATEIELVGKEVFETRGGVRLVPEAKTEAATNVSQGEVAEDASTDFDPILIGAIVGGAVLVGAVASGGGGGGGGGGAEVTPTPPNDDTNAHQSGQISCQIARDDNNHADLIGNVGGSSDLRITSGSMQLNMPVSGAIAYFTGTYGSEEFRVSEFATIGDYPNSELIANGNFYPTNGAIDFTLVIGANGSFGDTGGQIGVEYVCSGNLTQQN